MYQERINVMRQLFSLTKKGYLYESHKFLVLATSLKLLIFCTGRYVDSFARNFWLRYSELAIGGVVKWLMKSSNTRCSFSRSTIQFRLSSFFLFIFIKQLAKKIQWKHSTYFTVGASHWFYPDTFWLQFTVDEISLN